MICDVPAKTRPGTSKNSREGGKIGCLGKETTANERRCGWDRIRVLRDVDGLWSIQRAGADPTNRTFVSLQLSAAIVVGCEGPIRDQSHQSKRMDDVRVVKVASAIVPQ
jgi:hypothetical protein